jgi:hypothetical protein
MQQFVKHFILPIARKRRWEDFCEIGASTGLTSDALLVLPSISYSIVDPCLDADLAAKYASDKRVVVRRANSLDALPTMDGSYDCILIDGDHNWYTVYNELRLIRERSLLKPGGMIFFHDVGWPYGRRDLYYQPDTIPVKYRQSFAKQGIVRGRSELSGSEGINSSLCNAIREGGEKNGVRTAVEDFVREHPSDYNFCCAQIQWGLGIMQYRRKRVSEDVGFAAIRAKSLIYGLYGLIRQKPEFSQGSAMVQASKRITR